VALARERTIPTERPPLVDEVSANFFRIYGCLMVSAAELKLVQKRFFQHPLQFIIHHLSYITNFVLVMN
jgi:hypothetical protein